MVGADGRGGMVSAYLRRMASRRGGKTIAYIRSCRGCGSRSTEADGLVAAMRQHAGISQAELARRMGVAQSRVVRLEQQGSNVRLTTLQRAASACGLTVTVGYDIGVIEKQRIPVGYDTDVMG